MNSVVILLLKLFSAQNLGRMISLYLFAFITFMLGSCEHKEDLASRPYPRLQTLPVEQTAKGTIFTGEIFLNTTPITDHGFIWTTSYEPSSNLPKEYKISLGPKSGTGTFSATVSTTLQKTGKYTVKAYITSGQYTVFGTEVDFTSIYGSVAAQILSIQPQRAFLGDTLTIIGENFNYLKSSNTVRMDDIQAYR